MLISSHFSFLLVLAFSVEKFKFSQILLGDKNATSLCSKNISTLPKTKKEVTKICNEPGRSEYSSVVCPIIKGLSKTWRTGILCFFWRIDQKLKYLLILSHLYVKVGGKRRRKHIKRSPLMMIEMMGFVTHGNAIDNSAGGRSAKLWVQTGKEGHNLPPFSSWLEYLLILGGANVFNVRLVPSVHYANRYASASKPRFFFLPPGFSHTK